MIFPAPHTRETVASYGYRIARLSGLSSLPEMVYLFDLDLRALLMGDRHSVERLARYTGCDPSALSNGALDASNPRRLQLGADPRNKVMCAKDRFRFCPACLGQLADGNLRSACLARTDWHIDANHVCAEHEIRLMTITPRKASRIQPDLSSLVLQLTAAQKAMWQADRPTSLECYIAERLGGMHAGRWIDDLQLDVIIHTAEVFGAMASRGANASWQDISADERRRHGCIGADVLTEGPAAVKDFLHDQIGRGRHGNDYRKAFGKAFNQFYFRKDQPAYRPICEVMAEYVGENFRFTGQEKVFGILTRGIQPTTLRSLCKQHGIGTKITSLVLKAQYGIRAGESHVVDPALIAELAPKLRDLLNAQDAGRHLGICVEVLRTLIADQLLLPDFRFNNRMMGFRPETLDAFLGTWVAPTKIRKTRRKVACKPLTIFARAHRTRTSHVLLAADAAEVNFTYDRRKQGLGALGIAEKDSAAVLERLRIFPRNRAALASTDSTGLKNHGKIQ
ncbi:TniQ family protein [Paracoccus sp. (in: a-proteobacteria)]|uniref:TniQ family protein n=1 Tax=Paracoccus sp. TaxID=267 RepID=UPI002AFF521B|nr:TniQ family protein [Paracoccus sp. (in: a-proteobacteria)]